MAGRKNGEEGYVLGWVVVMVMILMILVTAILFATSAYYRQSLREYNDRQAYLTARSIVQTAAADFTGNGSGELRDAILDEISGFMGGGADAELGDEPDEELDADLGAEPDEELDADLGAEPDEELDAALGDEPDEESGTELEDEPDGEFRAEPGNESNGAFGTEPKAELNAQSNTDSANKSDSKINTETGTTSPQLPLKDSGNDSDIISMIPISAIKFQLDASMGSCTMTGYYMPEENCLMLTAAAKKGSSTEIMTVYLQNDLESEEEPWIVLGYERGEPQLIN